MAMDPVPWFIEEGSHSTDIARQLAWAAFRGEEGIATPTDCQVLAQSVPNGSVRITPGTFAIQNRAPGKPAQMYIGRVVSDETVQIQPTTSTSSRTDLVVIRVENPAVEAWQPPANRLAGPYVFARVIPNVDPQIATVRDLPQDYSALTLAKITMPPSTATVQPGFISLLRKGAESPPPQSSLFTDTANYTASSSLPPAPTGSGSRFSAWLPWPSQANWNIDVPTWATEVQVYYSINPAINNNTWGEMRANWNNGRFTPIVEFDVNFPMFSGTNICYVTNGGGLRAQYVVGGRLAVNAAERGKRVNLRIEARTKETTGYGARGTSTANSGSVGFLSVQFRSGPTST